MSPSSVPPAVCVDLDCFEARLVLAVVPLFAPMSSYYSDITTEEESRLPLPFNWSKNVDGGEPFYKDPTGRMHVEHPLIAKARLSLVDEALPPGWRVHGAKETNEMYYSNQAINVSMCK